jgi:hypothetical protein
LNLLLKVFQPSIIVIYYPGGRVNVPFSVKHCMEKLVYPDNVVFREEPEGGILFNVDTGELKLVEDVAWGICDLIEKRRIETRF